MRMYFVPPNGVVRDPMSRAYRMKRDGYVWLPGNGRHRQLSRGTLISGYLLRRNDVFQQLVLETEDGVVNVNEEDVEALGGD